MNRDNLRIESPCTADWTTMTLADRGRLCGACRKVVKELTQMTEAEARELLASPPTEGLCVRYLHDATGEIVFRPRPLVPVARLARRAAVAALTLALPMSVAACMGAPAPTMTTMGAVAPANPQPSAQPSAAPEELVPVMGAPPPAPTGNR